MMNKYPLHPLCSALPMTQDEASYRRLRNDIKQNGQLEPILRFQGLIFNGRHRLQICLELGIEPDIIDVEKERAEKWDERKVAEFVYRDSIRVNKKINASQAAIWRAKNIPDGRTNNGGRAENGKHVKTNSLTVYELLLSESPKVNRTFESKARAIVRMSEEEAKTNIAKEIRVMAKDFIKEIEAGEPKSISITKAYKLLTDTATGNPPLLHRITGIDKTVKRMPPIACPRWLKNPGEFVNELARMAAEDEQALKTLMEVSFHHYKLLIDADLGASESKKRVAKAVWSGLLADIQDSNSGNGLIDPSGFSEHFTLSTGEAALSRKNGEARKAQEDKGIGKFDDTEMKGKFLCKQGQTKLLEYAKKETLSAKLKDLNLIKVKLGADDDEVAVGERSSGIYPPLFNHKVAKDYLIASTNLELIMLYMEGVAVTKKRFEGMGERMRTIFDADTYDVKRFGMAKAKRASFHKQMEKGRPISLTNNERYRIIQFLTSEIQAGALLP